MAKKLTRGEVEIWKKLRKDEGLTYEEIGKQRGWSRQVVARELGKLEPKKPSGETLTPASNFLFFINTIGSIIQSRCLKKTDEGDCEEMEFPAEDWKVSDFKAIFPEFIVVVRGKRSYLRPTKAPSWFCYLCKQRMETDAKIAELDEEITKMGIRLKNSLRMARREMSEVRWDLLKKINDTGADLRKCLLEKMDEVKADLQELRHNLKEPVEAARIMRIFGSSIKMACIRQYGRCQLDQPWMRSILGTEFPSPHICALCQARLRR